MYISYLLRLYRVRHGETWVWRASLENPLNSERRRFPDLHALFAFLEAETRAETPEQETGKGRASSSAGDPEERL